MTLHGIGSIRCPPATHWDADGGIHRRDRMHHLSVDMLN